jgi:DNA-directed RNA polymerase specialized sigma24 family protein
MISTRTRRQSVALSEREREVVELVIMQGFTQDEAARRLEIAPKTVHTRLKGVANLLEDS